MPELPSATTLNVLRSAHVDGGTPDTDPDEQASRSSVAERAAYGYEDAGSHGTSDGYELHVVRHQTPVVVRSWALTSLSP